MWQLSDDALLDCWHEVTGLRLPEDQEVRFLRLAGESGLANWPYEVVVEAGHAAVDAAGTPDARLPLDRWVALCQRIAHGTDQGPGSEDASVGDEPPLAKARLTAGDPAWPVIEALSSDVASYLEFNATDEITRRPDGTQIGHLVAGDAEDTGMVARDSHEYDQLSPEETALHVGTPGGDGSKGNVDWRS